jgi:hypothetical protein
MAQIQSRLHKISAVCFIFCGRESIPLRILILCVHLGLNDPQQTDPIDPVDQPLWTYFMDFSLGKYFHNSRKSPMLDIFTKHP